EHAHGEVRLAGPDVALERAERDDVEVVEPHVSEVPVTDVPGEDAVAVALGRRLREGTRTRNPALAHVEPVPGEMPLRDIGHDPSSGSVLEGMGCGCPAL